MSEQRYTQRAGEAGFSIIEGLIAALILAIILIGILPMVTQSMRNTLQGNDATQEANATIDTLETSLSLPFNTDGLTIQDGTTSRTLTDYYLLDANKWSDVVGGDTAQFTRTMTIEYFGGADLDDDGSLETPLPGTIGATFIQFKRLTIEIEKPRTLGHSSYTVVALKSY